MQSVDVFFCFPHRLWHPRDLRLSCLGLQPSQAGGVCAKTWLFRVRSQEVLFMLGKGYLKTRPDGFSAAIHMFSNRPKSFFYQSHFIAFGLTIPKWYNTWVSKIFFRNIFGKIFLKIFLKKIFTKNISNTQVLYHFGIVRTNAIQWLW